MKKEEMVRLCTTEFSNFANDYDNCQKEQIEGCEGCRWYVHKDILLKLSEAERQKVVSKYIQRLIKDESFMKKVAEDSFMVMDAVDYFHEFSEHMMQKFFKKAIEKNRPLNPWSAYSQEFNISGLEDEIKEWREHYEPEELIDIANRCMFLYFQMRGKKL